MAPPVTRIGQITNADVYLNGDQLVGRFKDFSTPDLEFYEIKHETLGQIAELSLPGRPLKALTGKMTIDFLDVDLMPQLYIPNVALAFALHSYADVFASAGVDVPNSYRVITNVSVMIRKVGGQPFKIGDGFSGDAEYSCLRFVQGLPGQTPWREIDVMNQVNRVNGKDVWSNY